MPHAVIVDDDPGFIPAVADLVAEHGYRVTTAANLREARAAVAAVRPSLLLVDLVLPDGSGLDLAREVQAIRDTTVLVITGQATVDRAVDSLRARVTDFLVKPLDVGHLRSCLASLAPVDTGPAAAHPVRAGAHACAPFGRLVGKSPAMQTLYEVLEKAAPTSAPILLEGESGTGKELVAEAVHRLSPRREGPFLALNCGAIPAELLGSELFGHERGSFTSALHQHRGYFERAAGGTLFLDEVSAMPLEQQVQLLRVLESGTLVRIGGDNSVTTDVRLVAATNRALDVEVTAGRFREDLYFRLLVVPVRLPPLRERGADVGLLAHHFLALLNEAQGTRKRFSQRALDRILQHSWPGNVRELKNAVHHGFILAQEIIDAEHLPEPPSWTESSPPAHRTASSGAGAETSEDLNLPVGTSLEDAERDLIRATLERFAGDKPRAAAALGISLKTLYNRLKRYQAGPSSPRPGG